MSSFAQGSNLTTYRWKNRLLLVFSTNESAHGYVEFNRSLLEADSGVADRDLIVFRIFEKAPSQLGKQPLSMEDAEALRGRFEIKNDQFTVILIGKDGGVKLKREHPVELQKIFDLIDSMPMRQQEVMDK